MASRTRWSTIPRASSWSATMRSRSAPRSDTARHAAAHRSRHLDAEVTEDERREVGDTRCVGKPWLLVEAGDENRDHRVTRQERAVAPPAPVVAAPEVLELPARRRRHNDLASVLACEGAPGALVGVRVGGRVED